MAKVGKVASRFQFTFSVNLTANLDLSRGGKLKTRRFDDGKLS